jgi:hypothetical protein
VTRGLRLDRTWPATLACLLAGALAIACSKTETKTNANTNGASTTSSASGAPSPSPSATAVAALRCSECHGELHDEWKASTHAKADRGALYVAMRTALGKDQKCDHCHAPLREVIGAAGEAVAAEGVTCDACHAMSDAKAAHGGGAFTLKLEDNVKYGPLCDAKNHYFHRMGCSPLHTKSEQCAGCHLMYRPLAGGGELPVFTEYDEWTKSGGAVECQSCHMPGTKKEVAVGAAARGDVSDHEFLGSAGSLRKQALSLKVAIEDQKGKLHFAITLVNVGAAHSIPTGAPEHRLVLRVRLEGNDGAELAKEERSFGRVLVDAAEAEAPFYKAIKVARDDRLGAGETRTETFDFDVKAAGNVVVDVVFRDVAPAIAATFGVTPVDQPIVETKATFGAVTGGKRAITPATSEVKP